MAAATDPAVGFAADGAGGYILPGFLPAFDGAAALLKMLDLLGRSRRSLGEVVDGLPKVHLVHETVVTPWEQKGMVMRSLMEMAGRDVELVDGVKVALRRRLGAGPARPGGAGHARLGGGRHRRRGPQARPGVRPPDPSARALSDAVASSARVRPVAPSD